MKVFVPASSTSDSSFLLYKMLKETDHEICSLILNSDASEDEIINYSVVCSWLSKNVRRFKFRHSFNEIQVHNNNITNKEYLIGWYAKRFDVDLVCAGYNTYNWSHSNWFFQTEDPIENFYTKENSYFRVDHSAIRDEWDGEIHWPLMNRKETPIGRWQIWESLPEDLRNIVSRCKCGECPKCLCEKYYYRMKSLGFDAKHIDNEINKLGEYGPYYTKDSKEDNRHMAYING